MTEYDYSPEALEQLRSTQERISQWSGSQPQRFHSQSGYVPSISGDAGAFPQGAPYDDHPASSYSRRSHRRHHRRGRSSTRRPLDESYRSRSGERFYPDVYSSGQNPTLTSFHGLNPGGVPPPLSSRHASMNQGYFPSSASHDNRYQYDQSRMYPRQYSSSRRSYSRSRGRRYPSQSHIQLHRSMSQSSRSRSPRTSSRDSYSSHSYSSRSRSYSPSRRYHRSYRTVHHASLNTPTVVQPSRHHPTVVPINGGAGGYVVVPAVGQSLRVVKEPSLLGKILSPSKWGILRKKY